MMVVTSESIANKRIVRTLGIVRGNTVRARHIGKDILAGLRNIVGGEVHEYAKLVAESREQSLDRMMAEAKALGANAVITTRFTGFLQPPLSVRRQRWKSSLQWGVSTV